MSFQLLAKRRLRNLQIVTAKKCTLIKLRSSLNMQRMNQKSHRQDIFAREKSL